MSAVGVFDLEKIKNPAKNSEESFSDVKIIENGKGVKIRILNLENPKFTKNMGIVELEPVKFTKRHRANAFFRSVMDREHNCIVGIPQYIDSKSGEWVYEKITLDDKESLDLSNPKEAMKWACIQRSHFFTDRVGDIERNKNFQQSTRCAYKAFDKEKEAEQYQIQKRNKRKAEDLVDALVGVDLEDMGLMMGINPKTLSSASLYMEVSKFAEREPKKFLEIYYSDSRLELATLKRAESMGVITQTLDKGYTYGGLSLGFNEAEVVKHLKDNPQQRISIDTVARKNESDGQKSMNIEEKVALDAKDAEIIRLKKEMEALKRQASEATNIALEHKAENDLMTNDPELHDLIVRGKQLGLKGVHNTKDKEKLREKIRAKELEAKN